MTDNTTLIENLIKSENLLETDILEIVTFLIDKYTLEQEVSDIDRVFDKARDTLLNQGYEHHDYAHEDCVSHYDFKELEDKIEHLESELEDHGEDPDTVEELEDRIEFLETMLYGGARRDRQNLLERCWSQTLKASV